MMNENDRKVLRDWTSAFNKAMCEKDVKTLDILMDHDLVLVHMSGATQSKESWLQDIADETMPSSKQRTSSKPVSGAPTAHGR